MRNRTIRPARRALRDRRVAVAAFSLALSGCALDVGRDRYGVPLRQKAYDELELGRTDLAEALEKLGAPDLVERENDAQEDHLWWLHKDASDVNIRFQLPFSFFGYRHNVFQYFQGDDQTNRIHLVFNEEGVLEQKDLTLPPEYAGRDGPEAPGRFHVTPRFEHSFFLAGDGDFADYDDLFANGYLAGIDFAYQPVAPLVFGAGASYQSYQGETVRSGGASFGFGDLELATAEVQVRLQIPFVVFANLFNYAELRRIILDEDPSHADGWLVYVEGGLGVTYNDEVEVRSAGATASFYDRGAGLSSLASAGVEYSWANLSLRLGVDLRSTDPFDEGNSTLADEGGAFQTWGAVAAVAVKF